MTVLKSILRTTSANEAEITGEPTADSGKYETETWIERIEVRGLDRTPHNVSVRPLQCVYDLS